MSMSVRTLLAPCALLATVAALTVGPAQANPVLVGTSYELFLAAETNPGAQTLTTVFDGLPEALSANNLEYTISETQSSLGGERYRIGISVVASGELFAGGGGSLVGLGIFGPGLQLDHAYFLEDGHYTLTADGGSFTTSNLADDYRASYTGAWDGRFAGLLNSFVNPGGANQGFYRVDWDFTVRRIDAPGTAALLLLSLALGGLTLRRRTAVAPAFG
jgi:hypothetical protein